MAIMSYTENGSMINNDVSMEYELNENSENYDYEYKSESQKSTFSINEMKINSDEEKILNENSENYGYEYTSESQKSTSINEISINTDDEKSVHIMGTPLHLDLKTVGQSTELSSDITKKNDHYSTQEDLDIELYTEDLQTFSIQKRSVDSSKTITGKSDWSGMDRPKTSVKEHRTHAGLKKLLLDFTIGYLMDGMGDLVDYGVQYFNRLKKCRGTWPAGYTGSSSDGNGSSGSACDEASWPVRSDCERLQVLSSGSEDDKSGSGCPVRKFAKSDEQRQVLLAGVRDALVSGALNAEQTGAVVDAMYEREVRAHDVVIEQGDEAGNFYVVESGTYEVRIADRCDERTVRTYAGTGSFGELGLLYDVPQAITVVAKTDGVLWTVDRRTFGRVVRRKAARDRRDTLLDRLISGVPTLAALQPSDRMNLADTLQARYYRHGDRVVSQGDPCDGLYFVVRGAVHVRATDRTGECEIVNTVREGGHVGDLAPTRHNGHAASVYADGDVELAFLDVGVVERLLGSRLDVAKRNSEPYEQM